MSSTLTTALVSLIALTWGSTSLAQNECPNPEGGDCCTATAGIWGCTDVSCCQMVCDTDSFCCETEWDAQCVKYATELCGCSGGGGGDAPNDGCSDAIEINLGSNSVSNIGATTNGPEDCDFFGNPQTWNDVWYVFNSERSRCAHPLHVQLGRLGLQDRRVQRRVRDLELGWLQR